MLLIVGRDLSGRLRPAVLIDGCGRAEAAPYWRSSASLAHAASSRPWSSPESAEGESGCGDASGDAETFGGMLVARRSKGLRYVGCDSKALPDALLSHDLIDHWSGAGDRSRRFDSGAGLSYCSSHENPFFGGDMDLDCYDYMISHATGYP